MKCVAEVESKVTGESEVSNEIFFHEVKNGDPDHQVRGSDQAKKTSAWCPSKEFSGGRELFWPQT